MIGHRDRDVAADIELRDFNRFFLLEGCWVLLVDLSNDVDDLACERKPLEDEEFNYNDRLSCYETHRERWFDRRIYCECLSEARDLFEASIAAQFHPLAPQSSQGSSRRDRAVIETIQNPIHCHFLTRNHTG